MYVLSNSEDILASPIKLFGRSLAYDNDGLHYIPSSVYQVQDENVQGKRKYDPDWHKYRFNWNKDKRDYISAAHAMDYWLIKCDPACENPFFVKSYFCDLLFST